MESNNRYSFAGPIHLSPYYTKSEIQDYMPGLELSSAAIESADIIGNYDLFKSFPQEDIPVHFIVGDDDHNTPADLAFEYYEFLDAPAKSFTRIDDAAHMVLCEQPKAWAEALVKIKKATLANAPVLLSSNTTPKTGNDLYR